MKMPKRFHVYILMNKWNTTSYIGITSDLNKRILQHKQKEVKGFTAKYNLDKLIHLEEFNNVYDAISREKQLKRWSRKKKIELIKRGNPELKDISDLVFL